MVWKQTFSADRISASAAGSGKLWQKQSMCNFPSYKLTVQKRGSRPVRSASHIPEFSYDEELQTLIVSFEEMEGSREEMERASNDDSFWGAEILKDGVSMTQPARTSGRARPSPSSSRDSVTRYTQRPHSPTAGHAAAAAKCAERSCCSPSSRDTGACTGCSKPLSCN